MYLAIMDNPWLLSLKHGHLKYLEDLLKALLNSSLKISPRKCQLLELNCNIWVTPFLSKRKEYVLNHLKRLKGTQKLKPPMTEKDCKSFVGVVNYLSAQIHGSVSNPYMT